MANRKYIETDIYEIISCAFNNLNLLARKDLEKARKKMSQKDKWLAECALVYMNDVAKNPAKYFSRAYTEQAWHNRALEYAKKNNLKQTWQALYIVETPAMIANSKMTDAFVKPELRHVCFNLCEAIKDWEYHRTAKRCNYEHDAEKVIGLANRIDSVCKIATMNPVKRKWMEFVKVFQR